jgi:intracellular septation protein
VRLLLDLLPVVVFFAAFKIAKSLPEASTALVITYFGTLDGPADQQAELSAVIVASLSAIAATIVQICWLLLRRMPVKPSVWISGALVVIFGGLTVWLHNEWFIKWKPSILYWIFALVLAGGKWIFGRNLLGSLFSHEFEVPEAVWDRLLIAWIVFFLALGGANIAVAYTMSTEAWVNFKTFGLMGLTFGYSLLTAVYMTRYLPKQSDG